MYANLVLKSKTRMTDQIYTYKIPKQLTSKVSIGQRVIVPFGKGNRTTIGIIIEFLEVFEADFQVKDILGLAEEEAILNEELIDLALFMKEEYLSDLSSAFQTVLPPGDLKNIQEVYLAKKGGDEFLKFVSSPKTYEEIKEEFPDLERAKIQDYIGDGLVEKTIEIYRDASIKKFKYATAKESSEKIGKSAYKQREIFNYLEEKGKTLVTKVLKETNSSLSSLKSLEEKGLIKIIEEVGFRKVIEDEKKTYRSHELNPSQKNVFDEIILSNKEIFLLQGVTGSGKTEIYLQLAREVLDQGKSALILVPEISLTPQTIERFSGRFEERVAVLHSKLSISERFDQWRMIKEGKAPIVVGTRSAVFAPLKNIGLIVIDEEHELSYVSETNPKYDALTIAEKRVKTHGGKLLLGSATPRVESYYKAKNSSYQLLELEKRAAGLASLPSIDIVDMREELKKGNTGMFAEALKSSMEISLENNEQIILFLNKRGYTSYVFCRSCGYVQKCEDCDSSLTYHATKGLSICHLCGKAKKKPLVCPVCASNAIKEFGAGTQKLEQYTKYVFPQANIARMDQDTMRKKGSYEKIYKMMDNRQIDILIGTQMLSKGFDFKNVSLVGVISADISLNVPDYRASERTFQLLTQVAGRSGRGDIKGQVYIQTYDPDHFAITAAKEQNYKDFYREEIKIREKYSYPPYADIALIRVSHHDRQKAIKKSYDIVKSLDLGYHTKDYEIIGPNPALIERIKNRFRYNIVIKSKKSMDIIKKVLNEKILRNKDYIGGEYRIYLMINPISFY